jgi:AcrR family transcriptional regulator
MTKVERRTQAERRAQTRGRLVEAAGAAFAEAGYAAAAVDEIACRAGVTIGALYGHFASKKELFLTVLEDHLESGLTELEETLRQQPDAERRVHAVVGFFDQLANEQRRWALLRIEFWLYALRHPELLPRLAEVQRRNREAIAALVRHYRPSLDNADTQKLTRALVALCHGLMVEQLIEDTPASGETYQAALRWMFAGLPETKEGQR